MLSRDSIVFGCCCCCGCCERISFWTCWDGNAVKKKHRLFPRLDTLCVQEILWWTLRNYLFLFEIRWMQHRRNRLQEVPIKMQMTSFELAACGARSPYTYRDAQTCGQDFLRAEQIPTETGVSWYKATKATNRQQITFVERSAFMWHTLKPRSKLISSERLQ